MKTDSTNMRVYIGALIMTLLQLFVGPIMSINAIVPNFLMAYTVVCIVVRPDRMHLGFAFIMGICFDLICGGPVGAMAFVMLVFSFIINKVINKFENVNLIISLVCIFVSVLFIEMFYGAFQITMNLSISLIDIIAYRVLPCAIYDTILCFIMFAIMIKVIAPPVTTKADPISSTITNSRW